MVNEVLQKIESRIPEDRRMFGTKLLMAGAETLKIRDAFDRVGIRNILVSYFYLRKKSSQLTLDSLREDFGRFDFVFLDSGGFTFLQRLLEGKSSNIDIHEYTEEYYEFIAKTKDIWSTCAEVDVVEELGRQYMEDKKSLAFDEGIPIVSVLQGEPMEEIDDLGWYSKYPYIALGSVLDGREYAMQREDYVRRAIQDGVLLHGFGMTSASVIGRGVFYTVDSTTWSTGSRYGNTMVFENGRIKTFDKEHKDDRKRFRNYFEEHGLIWEDIEADKAFEIDMMNALAWSEFANFSSYNTKNAYWLTEDEKSKSAEHRASRYPGVVDSGAVVDLIDRGEMTLTPVGSVLDDKRLGETLFCDTCWLLGKCPVYKAGERCGFRFNIQITDKSSMKEAIQGIMSIQADRVVRGSLFEKVEGGRIDRQLSSEIGLFLKMLETLRNIGDNRDEILIKAKGSGILEKFFSGQLGK